MAFGSEMDGGFTAGYTNIHHSDGYTGTVGEECIAAGEYGYEHGFAVPQADSLAPGASCTIRVGFSPRDAGARTRWLVVETWDAPGTPFEVRLDGTGTTGGFTLSARELWYSSSILAVTPP